jgi:serine/threonine-protein kinase HipA
VADGAVASIRLWGHDVGAVAEDPVSGSVVFEYAEAFRDTGLEMSPLRLPLSLRGPQAFPELARSEAFQGLPGVLADALPDAFGNAVIRRYFESRGRPDDALSPVQRLLYLGSRAMGALEFHPPLDGRRVRATEEALEVASLVEQARRVIEGDTAVAVPEMMQVGATAGGARAKALILWNRALGRVRSGFAEAGDGDEHWLIKFDGVSAGQGGHALRGEFQPGPWGRIEYAYSVMARRAGIEMSETHLLREREFAHFMTRRFDRTVAQRLHLHSLGGLLHADYNVRQVVSYEGWFRAMRQLGLGQPVVDEAFRRMVFNLAARNQDDHVKNIAFLMSPDGAWRLAPAYDLTWATGGRWAATHQMTAAGKDDQFTRDDLLAVGAAYDVRHDGRVILDEVDAVLDDWPGVAKEAGISRELAAQIGRQFRRFGVPRPA